MPVQRFGSWLQSKGEFDRYLTLLRDNHRDDNLDHVMCRDLVSIDWQGHAYDCDFNQMLGLPLAGDATRPHLHDLLDASLDGRPIRVSGHCYGCTAGQGSSCGGALGLSGATERSPRGDPGPRLPDRLPLPAARLRPPARDSSPTRSMWSAACTAMSRRSRRSSAMAAPRRGAVGDRFQRRFPLVRRRSPGVPSNAIKHARCCASTRCAATSRPNSPMKAGATTAAGTPTPPGVGDVDVVERSNRILATHCARRRAAVPRSAPRTGRRLPMRLRSGRGPDAPGQHRARRRGVARQLDFAAEHLGKTPRTATR